MTFFSSSRFLKLFLLVIGPVAFAIGYLWLHQGPFSFFGSEYRPKAWAFTDAADHGNSQAGIIAPNEAETKLAFQYLLKEGYRYPYSGLNFPLDRDSTPNIGHFDYLELTLKAKQGSRLPIVIGIKEGGNIQPNGTRFLEYIAPVSSDWTTQQIDFSQFRSPEWWLVANGKKESELSAPDFAKIEFLNVQSCQIIGNGKEDSIMIKDISFKKDMKLYLIFGGIMLLVYESILAFVFLKKRRAMNVVFSYTKTEAVNRSQKEEEAVFGFITSHYNQPNLSIADIQAGTGISESKVSAVIKQKTELSFKQFLNKLRLTESKRLLLETDLQISEIAYKVGYSNVTHFNRIFKEAEDCSPNDYRKQATSKPSA